MVAIVHPGTSIRAVLNYNENKVKEGVANCLEAAYYLKEPERLTFNQKLDRLQKLASLNRRTQVNTVHISLNFDPSERHSPDKLRAITAAYMNKIGFGEQPYLLYEHHDAGHPHVHILTTNIRADGTNIGLHNIGKIRSEQARKDIEKEFNLVRADDKQRSRAYEIKPVNNKVEYGKTATKRAITGVLRYVLEQYKFCSIPELNAVLHQYNVGAERGTENSRVYKSGGLLYRIRSEDGTLRGVPIKASDFYGKPTINKLQEYFLKHKKDKQSSRLPIKTAIDLALIKPSVKNLESFCKALDKVGIHVAVRQNKDGIVYGLTYVDHNSKCVFNGRDIGPGYSAKGILDRWNKNLVPASSTESQAISTYPVANDNYNITASQSVNTSKNASAPGLSTSLLDELTQHEQTHETLPYELRAKKKKRKKRRSVND